MSGEGSSSGISNIGKRFRVVGIRIGSTVSRAIASTLVSSAIATPAVVGEAVVQGASVAGAAQTEALGLLVLRLPLSDATRMKQLTQAVETYLSANSSALAQVAKMSAKEQMMTVGVKGSLIGAIAAATVQQSILTACFVAGTMPQSAPSYLYQSTTIALSVLAGVSGGAAGAAVGTLLLPGIGTTLGSLAGSFTASFIPYSTRAGACDEEAPWNPSRPLRVVEAADGWLEVADEQTAVAFARGWDEVATSQQPTKDEEEEEEGMSVAWRVAMSQPVHNDEMLVFLAEE